MHSSELTAKSSLSSSLLMMVIAYSMLQASRFHWQVDFLAWLVKPMLVLFTLLGMAFVLRRFPVLFRFPLAWMTICLVVAGVEFLFRQWEVGEPLELVILDCFAAIGLAAIPFPAGLSSLPKVISIFLASFLFFIEPSTTVTIFGVVFTLVFTHGLLQGYWQGIESGQIQAARVSQRPVQTFSLLAILLLLIPIAWLANQIPVVARFQSAWSPFSGGEAWSDPFSRSGVGDGQALVAATESAQTEGPVNSDLFIESKKRSLFDVVTDEYGKSKKFIKSEQNRAISLTVDKMQQNHKRLARAEQNSATFSLLRESVKTDKRPDDLDSDALFLVDGAGPLVLKMECFDRFDGMQWVASESSNQLVYSVSPAEDNDWFCLKRSLEHATLRSFEKTAVSFIHLESRDIPTPPVVEAWSIRQVNQGVFYRVRNDQLSTNIGNTLPEFTQVSLLRHGFVKPSTVDVDERFPAERPHGTDVGWRCFVEAAKRLNRGVPQRSWKRVLRIQEYLREGFSLRKKLETKSSKEEQLASPLEEFWEKRTGRDYHFATAAVAMLEQSGFSCRLAQGFYVDPDAYNPKTKKTSVFARDIHTWVELHVGDGVWLPIEVTPTYLDTPESKSWLDSVIEFAIDLFWWMSTHPVATSVILLVVVMVVWNRQMLQREFWWLWWRTQMLLFPARSVGWTLDWCQRNLPEDMRRLEHEPPGLWIQRVARKYPKVDSCRFDFLTEVNTKLYRPLIASEESESREACEAWVGGLRHELKKRSDRRSILARLSIVSKYHPFLLWRAVR